jgi:hypothetical protein
MSGLQRVLTVFLLLVLAFFAGCLTTKKQGDRSNSDPLQVIQANPPAVYDPVHKRIYIYNMIYSAGAGGPVKCLMMITIEAPGKPLESGKCE